MHQFVVDALVTARMGPSNWYQILIVTLFVAFPWVETSTGPGGFMICVFII